MEDDDGQSRLLMNIALRITFDWPVQIRKVLDVLAVFQESGFSAKAAAENLVFGGKGFTNLVYKLFEKRLIIEVYSYPRFLVSKDAHFVVFAHSLQKDTQPRPFQNLESCSKLY